MRKVSLVRVITLAILLTAAAITVHGRPAHRGGGDVKPALERAFADIPGWQTGDTFAMGDRIVDALKLDDHLFRSFRKGGEPVTLYIGYYRTAGKVGAAHDPLVCFSGQGWQIGKRASGSFTLTGAKNLTIDYSSMIAERQGERELIVYWFQTNGETSAGTLSQKVAMFRDRLSGNGEENAFVRITAPIEGNSEATARRRIFGFMENFYPAFHRYVVGSGESESLMSRRVY
jgi:EpsI family protein